jgi:hypothetical protein
VSAGEAALADMSIDRTGIDDPVRNGTAFAGARNAFAVELAAMDAEFLGDVWNVLAVVQRRAFPRVEMHRAVGARFRGSITSSSSPAAPTSTPPSSSSRC